MPPPKKKPFQDYYKLFGLPPTASHSEIKTAYRELALKLHPDQNPSPKAHEQFLNLNEAYHVLNNPKERARYDIRYKAFYNPHKKSVGLNERIELTRAKRASRYGRTMYSQRMRYRGSSGPSSGARERKRNYPPPPPRESNYNWEEKELSEEELTYRKYAGIIKMMTFVLLLFASYNLSDYFVKVVSDKLQVVETVSSESGDVQVFARKYYYQSYKFFVRPKDREVFTYDTEVQLERSYFKGRLASIRVYKDNRIFLIDPIRPFFDYKFYLLIVLCLAGLATLVLGGKSQRTIMLGAASFTLGIILFLL